MENNKKNRKNGAKRLRDAEPRGAVCVPIDESWAKDYLDNLKKEIEDMFERLPEWEQEALAAGEKTYRGRDICVLKGRITNLFK